MNKSAFESPLSKFSYGVYVIASSYDGKHNGCAVAWVCRVSFIPPIVAVSLAPERETYSFITQAGTFALSILPDSERGIELGRHFGLVSGREVDKFANVEYFTDKTGSPILKESVGYVDCEVSYSTEAGDHTIFIAEIISGKVLNESIKPLAFFPSHYFGR